MINKRAQTSLEVAVLIVLVAAGLLSMYVYLRRSIQSNWRTNTDSFSEVQYEPSSSTVNDFGITYNSSRIDPIIGAIDNQITNLGRPDNDGIIRTDGWGTYNIQR